MRPLSAALAGIISLFVFHHLQAAPKARSVGAQTPRPPGSEQAHSASAYARHLRLLRRKLGRLDGRFTVVVQRPFVVIGDGPAAKVRGYARGLIKRTVDSLRREYFARDPARIIDIWLFFGKRSYRENTRRLTGSAPGTPFGFYLARQRALMMNIKTGGGTLVHELVHPFVEANVPGCPAWLNEGLGSLYEAVWWPGGKIRGLVNWRLPGLQRAIRRGRVPSFARLMAQNERDFYDRDPGTNYGQARYLLYYLQEKGLLQRYYQRFVADYPHRDKTGLSTLRAVLGPRSVRGFQRRWEGWVLGLRLR